MLHLISTLVLILIAIGLAVRHRRNIHPRIMFSAFLVDLALVLYIELTRGAVERVAREPGPLLWFHATISTAVLVAYVGMIVLGRRLLAGRGESRRFHRNLGVVFCVLRLINYVTSYLV